MAGAHRKASVAKSPRVEALNCEVFTKWNDLAGIAKLKPGTVGHSVRELLGPLGISRRRLMAILHEGVADGTIVCEKGFRRDIAGRVNWVPVYTLQKKGKK